MLAPVLAGILTLSPAALAQNQGEPSINIAGSIALHRLVEIAASRTSASVSFNESDLRDVVHTHLAGPIGEARIWPVVNDLLAARGWTTIRSSSHDLAVVRLTDAARLAPAEPWSRIHDAGPLAPGFAKAVTLASDPAQSQAVIRALLSPAGSVELAGSWGVVVADLLPRLRALERTLADLGQPMHEHVASVPLLHALASDVLGAIDGPGAHGTEARALPGRAEVGDNAFTLRLRIPSLASDPAQTAEAERRWRALVARLDLPGPVSRVAHATDPLPAREAADMLRWHLASMPPALAEHEPAAPTIIDDPSLGPGTLAIIATARQHALIERTLQELRDGAHPSQRHLALLRVQHRDVLDVLSVLQTMLPALQDPAGTERSDAPIGAGRERGADHTPDRASVLRAAEPSPPSSPGSASNAGRLARSSTPIGQLTLAADEGTNTIIAIGDARSIALARSVLPSIDVRPPQVLVRVTMVTLSEQDTRDLGVELEALDLTSATRWRLSSLFGLSARSNDTRSVSDGPGLTGVVLDPGDFSIVVRALQSTNAGRSIAQPQLLVSNNQQAIFDAVRQEPFASINAGQTVSTTSLGGTSDAGTRITVTPRVARGGYVALEYAVELSAFAGAPASPTLPPPRQQNSVGSSALVPAGHTIAIGGIDSASAGQSRSTIPVLGDLPLVGDVFGTRSTSRSRARFFAFIRADVVGDASIEPLRRLSATPLTEAGLAPDEPALLPLLMP